MTTATQTPVDVKKLAVEQAEQSQKEYLALVLSLGRGEDRDKDEINRISFQNNRTLVDLARDVEIVADRRQALVDHAEATKLEAALPNLKEQAGLAHQKYVERKQKLLEEMERELAALQAEFENAETEHEGAKSRLRSLKVDANYFKTLNETLSSEKKKEWISLSNSAVSLSEKIRKDKDVEKRRRDRLIGEMKEQITSLESDIEKAKKKPNTQQAVINFGYDLEDAKRSLQSLEAQANEIADMELAHKKAVAALEKFEREDFLMLENVNINID